MGNAHRFFCGIYSINSFTGASMKGWELRKGYLCHRRGTSSLSPQAALHTCARS